MVLELKEYTMASLGYKSSKNPLISANQTRPSPFSLNIGLLPFFFFLVLLSLFFSSALANSGGQRRGGADLPLPSHLFIFSSPQIHVNRASLYAPLFCVSFPANSSFSGEYSRRHGGECRQSVFFYSLIPLSCSNPVSLQFPSSFLKNLVQPP